MVSAIWRHNLKFRHSKGKATKKLLPVWATPISGFLKRSPNTTIILSNTPGVPPLIPTPISSHPLVEGYHRLSTHLEYFAFSLCPREERREVILILYLCPMSREVKAAPREALLKIKGGTCKRFLLLLRQETRNILNINLLLDPLPIWPGKKENWRKLAAWRDSEWPAVLLVGHYKDVWVSQGSSG